MKTIIFDMDGTIIDSKKAIIDTVNGIRADLNLKPLDDEFILRSINNPKINLAYEFYGLNNPTQKDIDRFDTDYVANYIKSAVPYKGMGEVLKNCKDSGYFVALATNAPTKRLEEILDKNNILEFFDALYCVDNSPKKPDPTMLIKAIDKGKNPKNIFVGDSEGDYLAYKNAIKLGKDLKYLNVVWGFEPPRDGVENFDDANKLWEFIKEF